jgi:hypothetical protein
MDKIQKITDLKQDTSNANLGTERGGWMIRRSLERNGAGRSILVDKDGNIIAGNKTAEAATEAGLKIKVIQTAGDELIVVQRTDLDLNDAKGKARELAFADNRVSEVNLNWDLEQISSAQEAYADLSVYFRQSELDDFAAELAKKAGSEPVSLDQAVSPSLEQQAEAAYDDGAGASLNPAAKPSMNPYSGNMTQATRVFYLYIEEARYARFQKACEVLKKQSGCASASDALVDLAIKAAEGSGE